MSLVCFFPKSTFSSAPGLPVAGPSPVDIDRLSGLLCPYQGAIERFPFAGGELLLSSLAERCDGDATAFLIPAQSARNPQTAWVSIRVSEAGVRFETDPLGMFPLWCYEDDHVLIITSEVKSLLAFTHKIQVQLKPSGELLAFKKRPANFSPYENVRRIQPGAVLAISRNLDVTETGGLPLVYQPDAFFKNPEDSKVALTAALQCSAKSIAAVAEHFGVFLSGGIDSSTVTALINRLRPGTNTYTLGTEFGDEYADAADLATSLNIPHAKVFAGTEDASAHFKRAIFCNETVDGLTAETLAQLSVLGQTASQGVTHIVTGYGADLLFGSMLRHELYMKVTGVDDLQSLIERTCWTGEFSPFFAWSLGLRVHHLFWDPQLMNCAFRIPFDFNYDGQFEKVVLRSLAVENGWMQHAQAFRKKYALTDGTQFNRLLSNVLQLADKHAYLQKSEHSIAMLKELYI